LKFPDKVTVTAFDSGTGREIAEVAFVLWLKAQKKNDYFVGPIITDRHGQAIFTRDACERSIARAQEMFIMDYAGDLLSCKPTADLRLHTPENISTMINQYEAVPSFWGGAFDNPQELFRALRSVRNSLFEPFHLAVEENDILEHPAVSCFLRRKSGVAL
jgi:hypothetical protein